ncbi:hypothetical protein LTR54_000193 [Friedmanniomyces endolithicus]|uniref:Uncharacterized protein n=1 Tax=Friedmanniomyces endolithicus TaxID=329885 RepID=A0AAN6G3V1_9PEZI|nr:hypothetical protein LTR82_000687 [Friedmanniomyces endolithicus]KAK1019551.1 hypothetical protein LTR54_000193 [Friedmanniomyces endolithicus]
MPAFWGAVSLITLSSVPLASLLVIQRIVEDQARSSAVTSRQAASPGSNDDGSRLQSVFNRRYWGSLPFIRMLPYFLYMFGILFNIAAALSISGTFNLTREKDCRGAMYVCLVFYVATKTCVQLFLIERAHAARARSLKRLQDWIWLLFMFVLIVGFGTIAILAFMAPVGILDPIDKQCRIGLPRTPVMVLMTYDILINIALTAVFIALLLPLLRSTPDSARARLLQSPTHSQNLKMHAPRHQKSVESTLSGTSSSGSNDTAPSISHYTPIVTMDTTARDAQANRLRMLIGKSIFGAVVMLTATILNWAFLYKYRGAEHGWICFACCLIDGKLTDGSHTRGDADEMGSNVGRHGRASPHRQRRGRSCFSC